MGASAPHFVSMHEDLIRIGLIEEDEIAVNQAALSMALLDHPGEDLPRGRGLLDVMAARLEVVGACARSPAARADELAAVLAGEFGFRGDEDAYDDPANADLMMVLDRRRGLPVSLPILWVALARRLGWRADVLDVPGHVLVAVVGDGLSRSWILSTAERLSAATTFPPS